MGHCTQVPFSREEFTGDHTRVGRVYAARKPTTREEGEKERWSNQVA